MMNQWEILENMKKKKYLMVNDQKNYQTKIKETRDIVKCDDSYK